MSERIYAFLLRLYPSRFRETYSEAALQLFRDRSRHERGFVPTLRLWSDLLVDLMHSVPREYRDGGPALMAAPSPPGLHGVPLFFFLDGETPRLGALFFGAVLSLTALSVFSVAMGHGGANRISLMVTYVESPQLDALEKQRVVVAVTANLKHFYVDEETARKVEESLVELEKRGAYDSVTDGAAFANLLTQQIRGVSQDRRLIVVYSNTPLPYPGPRPGALEQYRKAIERDSCTFEEVAVLPHNIGYLKLNSFPALSVCRETATAAMSALNDADAVIFDLRDNRGGFPEMVALLAAYLFDRPEYLYNPRENTSEQSWTQSPVPGNQLADKPVYVLTSAETLSGAEQFSYDLKMLKRATLVGETTGGSAHAGTFHRMDDHFGMGIPETKAINPFSKTDWEGTGVEPDVQVKAGEALDTARKLAQAKLEKTAGVGAGITR